MQSVTLAYRKGKETTVKEITDRDEVKTCVKLSGFLRYRPFASAEVTAENVGPEVTVSYHLYRGKERETLTATAANTTVNYRGKLRLLKNEGFFVNLTEGLFFQEMIVPADLAEDPLRGAEDTPGGSWE